MPTDTFFRLPDAKRARIVRAAWEEFTAERYSQVSINRIVHAAGIPRGSFYQYFADKEDLFQYLADDLRAFALRGYLTVLEDSGGNMFRAAMEAFDRMRALWGTPETEPVDRFLAFVRRNPGFDVRNLTRADERWLDPVWQRLDGSMLRRRGMKYLRTGFNLCLVALGHGILESLSHPDTWEENRAQLTEELNIIQFGCVLPEAASETEKEEFP